MKTQSVAPHTPIPWKHSKEGLYLIDANDKTILRQIALCGKTPKDDIRLENERKENAAFIVRAVNSHEELISASQSLLNALDADNPENATICGAKAVLSDAIAKAEEK